LILFYFSFLISWTTPQQEREIDEVYSLGGTKNNQRAISSPSGKHPRNHLTSMEPPIKKKGHTSFTLSFQFSFRESVTDLSGASSEAPLVPAVSDEYASTVPIETNAT
jgi:hypothetical protein